jgi:hypothetical protein
MSVIGGPQLSTNGLVMCLDAGNVKSFVSGSTIMFDLSGFGNTGSLVSTVSYTSSFGGGIVNNNTAGYVRVNDTPSIGSNILRTVSISVWFRLFANNSDHSILVKMQSSNVDRQYCLFIQTGNNTYFTTNDATGEQQFVATPNFQANTIYHFVGTIDRTNRIVNQYVNGALVASSTNAVRQTDMDYLNEFVAIGGHRNTPRFNGVIHSAQIYNRALTASEVFNMYHSTKGRFGL